MRYSTIPDTSNCVNTSATLVHNDGSLLPLQISGRLLIAG